jgi:hypothetical protein
MKAICSISLVVVCYCLMSCVKVEKKATDGMAVPEPELTAQKYCASCHLFPDPALLDKETWVTQALPAMSHRFGIYRDRTRESLLETGVARAIVERANIFPPQQIVTDEEWNAINAYYKSKAPEKLSVASDTIRPGRLSSFKPYIPAFRIQRPAVSALAYDEMKRQLFVADCSREGYSSITILDQSFRPVTSLGLPHPVSSLAQHNDTLYVLSMGHFIPSDEPAGQLLKAIKDHSGKYQGYQRVLKDLKRPVHFTFGDFDADGIDEILICEFGNHTGSVSLFRKKGKNSFSRETLLEAPGAIKSEIADLDHDGRKDLVVLMAQGDEGIDIYYNKGNAKFRRERVLSFPAVYGSAAIVLKDFDHDGFLDIIYANGDNGDASRITKPYHGIRILLNDQHNLFKESYFYPMPGTYKVTVDDFDNDGDNDMAAIAFFTDRRRDPEQGFIYLENNSRGDSLHFSPQTIRESVRGRWLTMVEGDVNKDGFKDLILGSFTSMQLSGDTTSNRMQEISATDPLLVLKNSGGRARYRKFK